MVLPIIGPTIVTQSNNVDGSGSLYVSKKRYKQSKPYDLPAPYVFTRVKTLTAFATGNYNGILGGLANASTGKAPIPNGVGPSSHTDFLTEIDWARNFARAKFVDQCGEIAMMAVNIAERRQAYESMAALQLVCTVRLVSCAREILGCSFLRFLSLAKTNASRVGHPGR